MFRTEQLSRPNDSGIRQVQVIDAEWDYRDGKLNWQRAMSFLPNWGHIWVRVENGDIVISYGL